MSKKIVKSNKPIVKSVLKKSTKKQIKSSKIKLKITDLNEDVLGNIMIRLDYYTLMIFCSSNKAANVLCNKNRFWKNKFINDFGMNDISNKSDFKKYILII